MVVNIWLYNALTIFNVCFFREEYTVTSCASFPVFPLIQSSPDVFIPKDRSSDLEAISRVIQEARHFIYISIIDYLPLLSRNAHRLEPLCHYLSCFLWIDPTSIYHQKLGSFALVQVIKLHICLCVCVRAKVLVSYRRPYPRGSDPEEGPGPSADKLLGKDSSTYFQLHLVSEESVHGAGQLLTGSCKYKATTDYFQLYRYRCSLHHCLCVCRSSSTPECSGTAVSRE